MVHIVSTNWVYKNLNRKNLVIFDCSWYLPPNRKLAIKEFKKCHIRNSQFFDIDEISNQNSKLPHMVPKISYFQNKMRKYGVNTNTIVVVLTSLPHFSHPLKWVETLTMSGSTTTA